MSTRSSAHRSGAPRRVPAARTGVALVVAVLAIYALTASGTIASSDGTTMYQLARRVVLDHRIDLPSGNVYRGRGGLTYAKAGIGQALCAAPFVLAGEAAARAVHASPERREFVVRGVVSSFNLLIGALGVWALWALLRALGATRRGALYVSLAFAFATPQWVYAKTFLTEPLTTLCLLAGTLGAVRAREGSWRWSALTGLAYGWAIVTKTAMLAAVLPLLAWAAWDARRQLPRARVTLLVPFVACCAIVAWYNAARFGSPFASGYGAETSMSGFSTPLYVGLYGLLFSSGKSVFLYAPVLVLALPGAALLLRHRTNDRALMLAILAVWCLNLPVYASFMSWAGDGSWGPRYLVPFIGLACVPVAIFLRASPGRRHTVARWLTAFGIFVALGGVFIYFGAYLRETGEYPYTRDFRDPRFLQESHFNPAFSPVVGHWRMIARNAGEHLRGDMPRIAASRYDNEARTPLTSEQTTQLLHGFDVWWCYAMYAGVPRAPLVAVCIVLLVVALVALRVAWSSA